MNEKEKLQSLGLKAKVLLELLMEDPEKFDADRVVENLLGEYEKLNFKEVNIL